MANIITVMNFKGGVGKTTITMNLGYCLENRGRNRRVLLIDLDPQFNLSQYLLGYTAYANTISSGRPTMFELFEEGRYNIPIRPITDYIVNVDSTADGTGRLDIICSRLELYQTMQTATNACVQLHNKISQIAHLYDVIIIDCPPTISRVSEAAFYISNSVLIPIMPEFLCTIGLPLLYQSIYNFNQQNPNACVGILGAVINGEDGYSPEGYDAISDIINTCAHYTIPLFSNRVLYSRSYPKGARLGEPIKYTPYARCWAVQNFYDFTDEFINATGV